MNSESREDQESEEVEAIGWDAIDEVLASVYGDRQPAHYGTILPMMLGGNDPLQGISVYKNLVPEPHYHFVTYGFSELYEKESDDPEWSGFGFELTFRLACDADASDEPPTWPLNFLQNLARYVFKTGNAFDERHHMTLNGPIALEQETGITAVMLILDPELQKMDTPNGRVQFLQIVGLCDDEYELIQQGYFEPVASRVADLAPLSITDITRPSLLSEKATLDAILATEAQTNQREVFGTIVEWNEHDDRLELRIGATIVPQLKSMLTQVLAPGQAIAVYGQNAGIVFESGGQLSWHHDESLLVVTLPGELSAWFGDSLEPLQGEYQHPQSDNLRIVVVPVDIRDGEGNVTRTVG